MENIKEIYEKPVIIKQSVGLMNKFGRESCQNIVSHIDGIAVSRLAHDYSLPLYVVSEGALRRKYRDIYRAFKLRYPKVAVAYSYKTNYLSGICSIMHQEGAWAEVVSGFEYDIAKSLGVQGEKIIFNGPYKTREELLRAVSDGAKINVDSFDEIFLIEEIAKKLNKKINIGIRINMLVTNPPWDRFGFNYETLQAYEAVKRIAASGVLEIKGLHIHLGTYINETDIYFNMANKMVEFARFLKNDFGIKLDYIDIGGGYASINTLHNQWLPGEVACPSFDQYAEAVCPVLLNLPYDPKELPILILEPGRSIVDEAMHMIASVVSCKTLSNGVKALVIDAGVNLLPTSYWYKLEILPAGFTSSLTENYNIYGPLCMNIDCIRLGVQLPSVRRGDLLVIKNIGAYNFSQSLQFIQPRPAVVLISEEGKVYYLRHRETTEYIRQMEDIPEHVKLSFSKNRK